MGFFRRQTGLKREGRLLTLPSKGRAIICSDLHGQINDFLALLERSRFCQRVENGEDLYLILTGDVPDTQRHRHFDDDVPEDGDVRILEHLLSFPKNIQDHLVYLEGNHDFHLARLIDEVKEFYDDSSLSHPLRHEGAIHPKVLEAYMTDYQESFGHFLFRNNIAPYDMIARATESQIDYVTTGPIVVHLPGAGVLITHAGPVRQQNYASSRALRADIINLSREALQDKQPEEYYHSAYHQLLNNRYRNGDYRLNDIEGFCEVFSAGLLVTGHTPLSYLMNSGGEPIPGCRIENHLGHIGQHQVVLCTSFGAFKQETKVYLELELDCKLTDNSSLRMGHEIRLLHGQAAEQSNTGEL